MLQNNHTFFPRLIEKLCLYTVLSDFSLWCVSRSMLFFVLYHYVFLVATHIFMYIGQSLTKKIQNVHSKDQD